MLLKIMIADDERKTFNLVRVLATPMGHTVQPFADYQAAGQKSEDQRFDVCFVGMRLNEFDVGLNLAHQIRNSKPNHESIIVMLGTGDDIACRRKAFGEGADLILNKPIPPDSMRRMLAAFPDWKTKRCAARLPLFAEVICTSDGSQVTLHSLNISESGMLLQGSVQAEVGAEVSLSFKIAEIRTSLDVRTRIVRKEGTERLGVEFIELAPEDLSAIHLYVTGRTKEKPTHDDLPRLGTRRLFGS